MALVKASELSGGAYFKPADHMNDLAILIEPKRIDRDVPSTYKGVTRNRDEVTSDITVFKDSGAISAGEPSEVIKSGKVVHGMLSDTLGKIIGQATVVIVRKTPTKGGEGFVFRDPEPEHADAVAAWYEKREADIAAAMDDVPDFE